MASAHYRPSCASRQLKNFCLFIERGKTSVYERLPKFAEFGRLPRFHVGTDRRGASPWPILRTGPNACFVHRFPSAAENWQR
jgi:hypothetical protein